MAATGAFRRTSSALRFNRPFELSDRLGLLGIFSQIGPLVRVVRVIVKLRAALAIVPFGVPPTIGSNRSSQIVHNLRLIDRWIGTAGDHRVGGLFSWRGWVVQEWRSNQRRLILRGRQPDIATPASDKDRPTRPVVRMAYLEPSSPGRKSPVARGPIPRTTKACATVRHVRPSDNRGRR